MLAVHLYEMSMQPISGSRNYVYNLINSQNKYIKTSLLFQKTPNPKLPNTYLIPITHHSFHSCAWFKEDKDSAYKSINKYVKSAENYLESQKEREVVLNPHHIGAMLLASSQISFKFDLPIVVTCHGNGIYQNYDNRKIVGALEKHADLVVAVSKFVKNFIATHSNFPRKRIKVIPPGVNTTEFSPRNFSQRMYNKYKDYILFFGRIEEEKGVLLLPKIAENLPKDIKLIIAGQGKDMKKLIKAIHSKKLDQKAVITGYVSDATLRAMIATAKAVILPSVFNEPFSIAFLETVASGVPVVVSKRGGLNEIKQRKGIIKAELDPLAFASAAIKLATETNETTKRNLLKFASKFSWDEIAKEYVELYKNILKS